MKSLLYTATAAFILSVLPWTSPNAAAADITDQVKPDVVKKIADALPDKAPAKPKQPRKVLLFSKTNGFRHGSIPTAVKALTMLGEKTGAYTADHSEDESVFEADNLAKYDAVIMVNTTGEMFRPKNLPKDPEERKAALEREEKLKNNLVQFVRSGKGLAGTHSATDTYKNWKEYNEMMGGAFAGHPWHMLVPIRNLAPDHPVNAAFQGSGFEVTDEIYQFRDDTAQQGGRKYLLSLDPQWEGLKKGNRKDGFFPISWVGIYGGGRTFYCSLGHRDEIYYNPTVLKHYLAGFQFALGDLEADAKPAAE